MSSTNTAQNIIALLTRQASRPLKLDTDVEIQVKLLSLDAIERVQKAVEEVQKSDTTNPREQFLPVIREAVVGCEEVTLDQIGGFLLEDLTKIAEEVMKVGK